MTNGREVIPSRWNYRKISEVTTKVGSGSTPRGGESVYQDSGVPLIRSMNVHSSGFKSDGLAFIDADEARKLDHVIVQPSDVLLNITGASIGRVTTAPNTLAGARVNQHVCIIRPKEELSSSFLSYFLASPNEQARVMNVQVGATRQALTKAMILDWDVPVPPFHEQQEIVAEIEKQFSRLDEAVANLKRVRANLKRYRAAVLKAAVEGQLTEDWRKQHPDVEPASKLLERILAERRAKWKGRGKYQEPSSPDTSTLPDLSHGWTWAKLDQLLREPLRNGHSAKASGNGQGLRAFTLSAVTEGDFSEKNTKLTVAHSDKVTDLWAEPGDIYVERSNTPELVGLARLYKGPSKFAFIPDLLIRVRLIHFVFPTFVEVCLLSEYCRRYFRSRAQGISGSMPKIDQSVIEQTAIPLPPLVEQKEIVAEVERRLSVIAELESAVQANLTRADRLRQAILKRAFEGKLIATNQPQRSDSLGELPLAAESSSAYGAIP